MGNVDNSQSARFMTRQEVAATVRVSVAVVDRHIAAGRLPVARFGRRVLIDRAALEQFIAPK